MNAPRRGVSLVELLVVMTACSVVLTLTSALLCRVMRIQIESRAHADVERNSLRLSNQFRQDVHQAKTAAIDKQEPGDDVFLRLAFADGRLAEYSRRDRTVLRRVFIDDEPLSREEFEFPTACDLTIEEIGTPPRIGLTLSIAPLVVHSLGDKQFVQPSSFPVSLQVEAVVGRDLRFATTPAAGEAQE